MVSAWVEPHNGYITERVWSLGVLCQGLDPATGIKIWSTTWPGPPKSTVEVLCLYLSYCREYKRKTRRAATAALVVTFGPKPIRLCRHFNSKPLGASDPTFLFLYSTSTSFFLFLYIHLAICSFPHRDGRSSRHVTWQVEPERIYFWCLSSCMPSKRVVHTL